MALYGRKTLKAIQDGVDKAIPFKMGYVSGKLIYNVYDINWGRLPYTEHEAIRAFIGKSPAFVIYSYNTPIAVNNLETDEWVTPDVTYSQSTTGHQHVVRTAINNPGFYPIR